LPFLNQPKPFLDASRREWQFETFAWLLRHSGGFPNFIETTLVLPIEDHFPDRGMKGHAGVTALFRRVRDHAGMADWPCMVEPGTERRRTGTGGTDRIPVITYQPGVLEPTPLVATFAHELARYLVETFDERNPGGEALLEPAVELAAVFMGFGLFMANAAMHGGRFHLNEGEMVHALALFCLLRKLPPEVAGAHLNPHLRKYLRLATSDLAQYELGFRRLRSPASTAGDELAECTLPTAANRNP
jgi:hypothetical protein